MSARGVCGKLWRVCDGECGSVNSGFFAEVWQPDSRGVRGFVVGVGVATGQGGVRGFVVGVGVATGQGGVRGFIVSGGVMDIAWVWLRWLQVIRRAWVECGTARVGCSLLCEFTRWEFWDYLKMRGQRYQRRYQCPSWAVEIFRLRVYQVAIRCPVR